MRNLHLHSKTLLAFPRFSLALSDIRPTTSFAFIQSVLSVALSFLARCYGPISRDRSALVARKQELIAPSELNTYSSFPMLLGSFFFIL